MTRLVASAVAAAVFSAFGGDSGSGREIPARFDPDRPYEPGVTAAELDSTIDNPLFPAPVGATWTYESETEDGLERVEIEVLSETRDVMGFAARVVRDTVTLEGEIAEDTWDWYGQDAEGNVWYVGEETYEYEDGEVACSCGAWEWGEDVAEVGTTALPGIVMLADPQVGDHYRQEYYQGEAEDLGEVVEVDVDVEVRAGSFTGCIRTHDTSGTDPQADELKVYCPGVGVVLEEDNVEGTRGELVQYAGL